MPVCRMHMNSSANTQKSSRCRLMVVSLPYNLPITQKFRETVKFEIPALPDNPFKTIAILTDGIDLFPEQEKESVPQTFL
jgi:hypothetical protein